MRPSETEEAVASSEGGAGAYAIAPGGSGALSRNRVRAG